MHFPSWSKWVCHEFYFIRNKDERIDSKFWLLRSLEGGLPGEEAAGMQVICCSAVVPGFGCAPSFSFSSNVQVCPAVFDVQMRTLRRWVHGMSTSRICECTTFVSMGSNDASLFQLVADTTLQIPGYYNTRCGGGATQDAVEELDKANFSYLLALGLTSLKCNWLFLLCVQQHLPFRTFCLSHCIG